MPRKKATCAHCRQVILVRTSPEDRLRHLVTEDGAAKLEEMWERRRQIAPLLASLEYDEIEMAALRAELEAVLRRPPTDAEFILAAFDVRIAAALSGGRSPPFYERALAAYYLGEPFFDSLRKNALFKLRAMVGHGTHPYVAIDVCPSHCEECKSFTGLAMPIEVAIAALPVPRENCWRTLDGSRLEGFCRCAYRPLTARKFAREYLPIDHQHLNGAGRKRLLS